MIQFSEKVLRYTEHQTKQDFLENDLHYDATLRNLALIGEAANQIPSEIRDQYPQVTWRQIIGTRNRIIHDYLGIDDDVIWSIITDDIPTLLPTLKSILN
ncbi:MAG: DUF86 domain-containing protein [Cyanophyceae cyanobacterium]